MNLNADDISLLITLYLCQVNNPVFSSEMQHAETNTFLISVNSNSINKTKINYYDKIYETSVFIRINAHELYKQNPNLFKTRYFSEVSLKWKQQLGLLNKFQLVSLHWGDSGSITVSILQRIVYDFKVHIMSIKKYSKNLEYMEGTKCKFTNIGDYDCWSFCGNGETKYFILLHRHSNPLVCYEVETENIQDKIFLGVPLKEVMPFLKNLFPRFRVENISEFNAKQKKCAFYGQSDKNNIKLSWTAASKQCQQHGGHLPYFTSRDQLEEVVAFLKFSRRIPFIEAIFIDFPSNYQPEKVKHQ